MTNRTVHLHLGLQKTGTTFLQRRVFPLLPLFDVYNQRPDLLDEMGEHLFGNPRAIDHDALGAGVERHLDGVDDDILISWENLCGSPHTGFVTAKATARALQSVFPGARVLLTIRRQDGFVESFYKQMLHNFFAFPPRDFVPRRPDGNFAPMNFNSLHRLPHPVIHMDSLDWSRMVADYADVFGRENLTVLVYEKLRADPPAFMADLCGALGVPAIEPDATREENAGYSALTAGLARALNRFVRTPHNRLGFWVNRPFAQAFLARRDRGPFWRLGYGVLRRVDLRYFLQEVVDRHLPSSWRRPYRPYDDAFRREILAYHAEGNRRLDRDFDLGLDRYGYF